MSGIVNSTGAKSGVIGTTGGKVLQLEYATGTTGTITMSTSNLFVNAVQISPTVQITSLKLNSKFLLYYISTSSSLGAHSSEFMTFTRTNGGTQSTLPNIGGGDGPQLSYLYQNYSTDFIIPKSLLYVDVPTLAAGTVIDYKTWGWTAHGQAWSVNQYQNLWVFEIE